MRPTADIRAPMWPRDLPWVNVASLRMDRQRGRPVVVEFFDVFRPNSLRTLQYVKAWHERYAADGLRVISVHSPGFEPSRDEDAVRGELARLGVEHPVLLDTDLGVAELYGLEGWPSRYLFDRELRLVHAHFGEGAYEETERAVQELLGVQREVLAPLHPADDPDALIVVPTADQEGAYRGPYEAGAVWAVVSGRGELAVGDRTIAVERPGAYRVVEHDASTQGVLDLRAGDGVTVHATCFEPGLAP